MANAKTYLENELDNSLAQKIIFRLNYVNKLEPEDRVLAVFGNITPMRIDYAISTKGQLFYLDNINTFLKKNITIAYSDIQNIELISRENYKLIRITKADDTNVEFDIKAPVEETQKFYDFLLGYIQEGARSNVHFKSRIDIRKEKTIDNIITWEETFNKLTMSQPYSNYHVYCNDGIGIDIAHGPAEIKIDTINQLMDISLTNRRLVIPFTDIKSSVLTTEVEIPKDDLKNEYLFFIAISCLINNEPAKLIFSKKQTQYFSLKMISDGSLVQLNYVLENVEDFSRGKEEKITNLSQRREDLLAQRDALYEKMKLALEQQSSDSDSTSQTQVTNQVDSKYFSEPDAFEEIKKFKALLDEGIITQEEFDAKKKQLLNL